MLLYYTFASNSFEMRILSKKDTLITSLFLISCGLFSYAQDTIVSNPENVSTTPPFYQQNTAPITPTVTVKEDPKIKQILNLKNKMSLKGEFNDRYKIQLAYGNLKEANEILKAYKESFEEWEGSIVYQTPNYKIWVGNFRNQLEADRALLKIKEKFPDAFALKPKASDTK